MKGIGLPKDEPQNLEELIDFLAEKAREGDAEEEDVLLLCDTLIQAVKNAETWNDLASTDEDGNCENEESKADERQELFITLKGSRES